MEIIALPGSLDKQQMDRLDTTDKGCITQTQIMVTMK